MPERVNASNGFFFLYELLFQASRSHQRMLRCVRSAFAAVALAFWMLYVSQFYVSGSG